MALPEHCGGEGAGWKLPLKGVLPAHAAQLTLSVCEFRRELDLDRGAGRGMWKKREIEIIRNVDPNRIIKFGNADSEDGILLNHFYMDMRGVKIADARAIVDEEAALLHRIEEAGENDDEVERIIDELMSDESELSAFDVGVAGTIYALSAVGAAPITSCNGGLLDGCHAYNYPNVLFSIEPGKLAGVTAVAELTGVGLENASGHVLVYADSIPKLNAFADRLVRQLEDGNSP